MISWQRERCGKSEEAHAIMKEDLAGGKLPSDDFGINIPGRIIERSHEMLLRLVKGNPATELLIAARQRILALCPAPSG